MRQPARPRSSSTDKISQQSQGCERHRAMQCARDDGSAGPFLHLRYQASGILTLLSRVFVSQFLEAGGRNIFARNLAIPPHQLRLALAVSSVAKGWPDRF